MENYEVLAQMGDWESIQRLILMYADTEDVDEQRRISKAFYLVKNRKQLIAAFFTTLDNVDDLQKRFVILKLALRISRPAFLYEYLSCSLKLEVKPKGTGLFDKGIRPLSEYEKREVCRHIIDHFDYRIQIIHLAGDENIAAIQNSAFACIETGNITNHIIRCLEGNYDYLDKCQNIILGKLSSKPEKYSYLSKYLNINSSNIQMLLSSFQNTAMIWDATAHNIWLKEDTCISVPFLQTILKIDRSEPLSNKEKNEIKQRIVNDIELLSDIDSSTGNKLFMFLRKVGLLNLLSKRKP